ncbi:MAG: hypothetical protein LUG50_11630 [Planctomycetaceae bacterium]|nr:hypothetical protein [Planctomycetaceae bacterium]
MITTTVTERRFTGDGLTVSFPADIEGIPDAPVGAVHVSVSVLDSNNEKKPLSYGADFSYTAKIVNGFSKSIVVTLNTPLRKGETLIVRRTTPVLSISSYPDDKTPSKQVERDFDNVIKIVQEYDGRIEEIEEAIPPILSEIESLHNVDEKLAKDLATKTTELSSAITNEAKTRAQADNALSTRIDAKVDKDYLEGILPPILDGLSSLDDAVESVERSKDIALEAQKKAENLQEIFEEYEARLEDGTEKLIDAGKFADQKAVEASASANDAAMHAAHAADSTTVAETQATIAKRSATLANNHATRSETAAAAAAEHRDKADTAASDARQFSRDAYLWANERPQVPVVNDEYSAKHWASEAEIRGEAKVEKARMWAENPPGLPVEGDRYSARHYADKAAAVSDLDDHIKAEDPHSQYVRKDRNGSAFFEIDGDGDIRIRENIQSGEEDMLFALDVDDDISVRI